MKEKSDRETNTTFARTQVNASDGVASVVVVELLSGVVDPCQHAQTFLLFISLIISTKYFVKICP